jgi:hypothetical protein
LYRFDDGYRKGAKKRQLDADQSLGSALRRLRVQKGLRQSDFPGLTPRRSLGSSAARSRSLTNIRSLQSRIVWVSQRVSPTRSEDATIPVVVIELEQVFRRAVELDPADRIELLTLQGFEER